MRAVMAVVIKAVVDRTPLLYRGLLTTVVVDQSLKLLLIALLIKISKQF
jgi:hypothetical protein